MGEAAHIFGANPGSARYDADMSSADRSDITNAIWLCGNCHKLIDDDPLRYPAGLLFEWQREHERGVAEAVGKAGAQLRHRYEVRHLEEFGKLSYLAERIVLEKADYWEYKLTSEVLRFEVAPVLRRWRALKEGLYLKPDVRISKPETLPWVRSRFAEAMNIGAAMAGLMNKEFARAWGEPGVPGDDLEIVTTCRLFAEVCASALQWEETVRFTSLDDIFEEVHELLCGVAGRQIEEAAKVPEFIASVFAKDEQPSGKYQLSLEPSLPVGWVESFELALGRASEAYMIDIQENGMN